MQQHIYGGTESACAAVFVSTGPIMPADLQNLENILRKRYPHADIWSTPDGVVILVNSDNAADLQELTTVSATLQEIDIDGNSRLPQLKQESLAENLMAIKYTQPLTNEIIAAAELFVTVAAGSGFAGDIDGIHTELLTALNAKECTKLAPTRLVDLNAEMSGIWIQSKVQSGAFLRFCRPLPDPEDYADLLGRSVVNAVVGGLGNSLITAQLRDSAQLSYNPYSVLTYRGGFQWLVVDIDTSAGYEKDVAELLRTTLRTELSTTLTEQRVRHAVRFMLRLQKDVAVKPHLKARLNLTKVDGSDPFGASFARKEDFVLEHDFLLHIANQIFDIEKMRLIAVSQSEEPEWFSEFRTPVTDRSL